MRMATTTTAIPHSYSPLVVSFKRNTDYWGTVPAIDVNVVRYDTAAEVDAALKAQTLDAVLGAGVLSSTQINALAADARFDVRFTNAIQNSVVILNLDDLDLRKTIVHAVNKQKIIDDVKGGLEQSVYQLFPLSSPYCNHQFTPVFGYDLEKAKLVNCPLVPAAAAEKKPWAKDDTDLYTGLFIGAGVLAVLLFLCMCYMFKREKSGQPLFTPLNVHDSGKSQEMA